MAKGVIEEYLSRNFHIDAESCDLIASCEEQLRESFACAESIALLNQAKVLNAFRKHQVSSRHFYGSTGYGYGDEGRDKLGEVYASVFGTEDAIASPLFMSGTHAISTALFGLLRPGDHAICVTGEPYDTLRSVIAGSDGSLEEYGIRFSSVPLTPDNRMDSPAVHRMLQEDTACRLVYFQRSTGYDLRPAFTAEQIGEMIGELKSEFPDKIYFVDNCYGEFVDRVEPSQVGADVIAGSMIKNPGGGLAPTGGYIAGTKVLVDRIGASYSAPGIGREVGSYLPGYQYFFEGLFLAPHTVCQALKSVLLAAEVFSRLGYKVSPTPDAQRGDITQTIFFGNEAELTAFIRGIQAASPIDAHVVPYAWDMPGYKDKVIMAAGTFVQGASLEFTADGPIREPYAAYFQGALTYEHAVIGILEAVQQVKSAARSQSASVPKL